MEDKKYVKVYCKKANKYGLVTIEKSNGYDKITNFYEIDDATAAKIQTSFTGNLPEVSMYLKPNAVGGARTPRSTDKSRQCSVKKGELWYQCIYCSALEISNTVAASACDIYFLMDESGSMAYSDRKEGAAAVSKLVQSLSGAGNVYSFVAWGSDAGYVFQNSTNAVEINRASQLYVDGLTGHSGSTDAAEAFRYIASDVARAKKPVRIIFVTDGYFDDEDAAVRERNRLLASNRNVEILAIGITGASQSSLSRIGTVPAFSKVVGGSSALTSTFEQIAETLKKSGNNF